MIERGLLELRREERWVRAYFTAAGLTALRELAASRRYLDAVRYAPARRELSLEVEDDPTPSSVRSYAVTRPSNSPS